MMLRCTQKKNFFMESLKCCCEKQLCASSPQNVSQEILLSNSKKYRCLLCVVSVNRVEELLQFVGGQNSIGEVGFEFIKGQFPVIWEEKEPSFQLVLYELS